MSTEVQALRIIVMGVSGSGKSTLAQSLSAALHLRMKDGDELHLPQSVAKMSAGIALQDEDRWPWLERKAASLRAQRSSAFTAIAFVSMPVPWFFCF
jgi:carbohydrate kinase (thermoresistant glucokinase family)